MPPHTANKSNLYLINCLMLVHLCPTNVWCFNLSLAYLMHMLQLALKSVILKLCLFFTKSGLWLSWKKQHWLNAHKTQLKTLRLLLLRRTILSILHLLVPTEATTTLAVAADAVARETIVADEIVAVVVVVADYHTIIHKGRGISRGPILHGFHSSSLGPLLLAHIPQLAIGSNKSLQTVNLESLGSDLNRHTLIQHNRHTCQPTFMLQCTLCLWLLLMSSGTWIHELHLT